MAVNGIGFFRMWGKSQNKWKVLFPERDEQREKREYLKIISFLCRQNKKLHDTPDHPFYPDKSISSQPPVDLTCQRYIFEAWVSQDVTFKFVGKGLVTRSLGMLEPRNSCSPDSVLEGKYCSWPQQCTQNRRDSSRADTESASDVSDFKHLAKKTERFLLSERGLFAFCLVTFISPDQRWEHVQQLILCKWP